MVGDGRWNDGSPTLVPQLGQAIGKSVPAITNEEIEIERDGAMTAGGDEFG
jgi:hypothetical protein